MPAGKFVLNKGTIRRALKEDRGLAAATDDAAVEVAAKAGPSATIDTYTTDRHVAGVTVPSADQARSGTATRAAQSVASNPGTRDGRTGRGFVSRSQWRWNFRNRPEAEARSRARKSGSYAGLPERKARTGARG